MPPKKGVKRKATSSSNGDSASNGDAASTAPDRATWPGWVEMESEPAFFNVMLKEMGVRGVKVHEVYGLDEEMLAILPQPVHALIFLFRYRAVDEAQEGKGKECPDHVWFANQIPDFACASVALLNIVNNIKGLEMGKELRDFRNFTQDMDPLSRGDAIDSFDFVKHIHNSFARENDLLIADMHLKNKAAKAKKRAAAAKARDTREAKKEGKTPAKEKSPRSKPTPTRTSTRTPKKTANGKDTASTASSPLSDPPESDPDFDTPKKGKQPTKKPSAQPTRRSERKPKPRQDTFAASATAAAEDADEEGYHFIAYMPIQGHVWRMDGLDSFPQDLGTFDGAEGGDWMNIALPALQTRMAMYAGADIEFNLMAVVHDPVVKDRAELLRTVKELQAIDKKLDSVFEDWRALEGAETQDEVIATFSVIHDITKGDVDAMELEARVTENIEKQDDLMELIDLRKSIIKQQGPLRAAVRDALEASKEDDDKARHRRHDYGKFARGWLGALAEAEVLGQLLEGE